MTALAHGIGRSQDLPLPLDLVLQAGAAAVVVSFLVVAFWWRRPRLTDGGVRTVAPPGVKLVARLLALAASLSVVGVALAGPPAPRNPAPYALFAGLWVGLVPLSLLLGPVWRAVNPLRTVFRALRLPRHGFRPAKADGSAGRWPAALALLAFVWFELAAPHRDEPVMVGLWLVAYGLVQLGAAALRGEEWFARGDCFEVYSTLAGRLSPLHRRRPLAAVAGTPVDAGVAAFLAVWWGSTVFDSASASVAWADFVQRAGTPLLYLTAGLVLMCAVVYAGIRGLPGGPAVTPSLIPIAAAYTLAHYLTLLLSGPGARTAVPAPGAVAAAQVTLILLGHVLGVIVAHELSLRAARGRPGPAALADELPVVLLMIAFTWAGLFLLLTPVS
ncbi:hypothetical protein AB0368_03495 [Actinoplanes sp. NPDC051475]|uniref:hypothetical protein n=1 Tax=Actinoplanes sp. NPDC051475 TaxID=3157225 RepID=UPI00344C2D2A